LKKDVAMRYISKNALLFLLAVTLFLLHSGYLYNFTVDDAYISFRYADNLAQGKGMVFNVGERQEGYSNFFWVILLGFFSWLNISPILSSKLLSVFSGIGIFVLTVKLSRFYRKTDTTSNLIALFLIASNTSLVLWVASGLETIFYTFLLLLATYLFLREDEGKGTSTSAFFFFLLALTRPEGIIFFIPPLLFRFYDALRHRPGFTYRSFFVYCLIFFIPFGVYVIWKYLYFGVVLPNPFYAKFMGPLRLMYNPVTNKLRLGFHYLTQAFRHNNLIIVIPFLSFLWGMDDRERKKVLFIGCTVFLQLFFIMSVGGDWMPRFRFIVPIFPFIYLLFQEGVTIALQQVKTRLFSSFLFVTVLVMCMANFPGSKYEHYKYLAEKEGACRRIRVFGEWLKQSFPSHYTVAYEEAGIPMYYSGLRLLDTLGLLNRDIATIWYSFPHDYKEVNKKVVDYVLEKRPELIILVSKRDPKEWWDYYGGTDYTFYCNKTFQMNYELIQIKDWVLPRERDLWPEGLSLFVYLRKDLIPLHKTLL
jgi:hypothetical protein